ncbi:SRPBCC family protein [Arcticibacter eurypsychrophilus]|uniref:SRPBCC family protein n=1 Tax=Arcticibacter eurypsychrophilus TaxID=1434752 RepID=UPI00084DD5CF|nr:SRPBCC domain-containing protein [Arcticibacter eurypsychrophilus]
MEASQVKNIEIKKDFPVSKEQLYEAWTNADHLKKWWKPLHATLTEVDNTVEKAGKIKYTFENNGIKDFLIITGEYLEVEENTRLVYTWDWVTKEGPLGNGSYKLTVNFTDADQGSQIAILQESNSKDEAVMPHQDGWEKSLEDLRNYLSVEQNSVDDKEVVEPTAENESTHESDSSDVAGYREAPDQQKVGE